MVEGPFSVLIATTGAGIERAERSGGSWRTQRSLQDRDVRCLAAADGPTVLAGTQGEGIWRSDDGGVTWAESGLHGQIVKSLSFCASEPNVVYAGTKPPHAFRSDDGGRTWSELESFRNIRGRALWIQPAERPPTAYVQAMACCPTDPDVVIAGMEAGAIVRSDDGGRTWSNHISGALRDCHVLAFHPDGRHVQSGGGNFFTAPGVAISSDQGRSWERPKEGLDKKYGWAVAADPGDPTRVFVTLSPGPMKAHSSAGNAEATIYRREGGGPWEPLSGGLPQPLDWMPYALITHPSTPGYVVAGLMNGDLWETDDAGATWHQEELRFSGVDRVLIGI